MALASFKSAKSVTALSESPLFGHQYSSITAAISGLANNDWELRHVQRVLQEFWQKYFKVGRVIHWQTDVVNVFREYAPCLRERQYRHKANNVIRGNKALGLGYPLSEVNWADPQSGWSVPFLMRRIGACEDEALCGAEQIKALCERAEFAKALNVNVCDCGYGTAKYLVAVARVGNLVTIARLRHGHKVYEAVCRRTQGAPQVYGQKYYLVEESGTRIYRTKMGDRKVWQTAIYEREADEEAVIERETKKGRRLRIELKRWGAMKLRNRDGHSLKEVEFDMVGIRALDARTGARVFKHDQFVAVVGERRAELSVEEVAEEYRHRFDLEVTNRLMKQELFLQGYQTPALEHLDNWILIVQTALWLLWAASKEAGNECPKWQRFGAIQKAEGERRTAAETRKGLEKLLLSFERKEFEPKKCQKGRGRLKGEKQEPRKRYEVVRKWQSEVKISKNVCQRE